MSAQSQPLPSADYTHTLGFNAFQGFVIKHDKEMGHMAPGGVSGFELFWNKNTYGKQAWEQVFNYPDLGMSFTYFNFNNPYLDKTLSTFFYSDFYLTRTRHLDLIGRIGTGLSYHTKPYHKLTNNKNVAIGSDFTYNIQIRFGINWKINQQLAWNNNITISHFSQAALSQPNKGLNIVAANTGLSYNLQEEKPDYKKDASSFIYDKEIHNHLSFSFALKEIPPIGGPKYGVYVISYYGNKQISNTNILNLGFDFFANTALKEEMKHDPKVNQDDPPDFKRVGVTLGHELALHKVAFLSQLGYYIYQPYKSDKRIYQRYAIKFYLDHHLFAALGFVSHFAKADHGEWTIGYRF
ncbi:MAG: acyloxyacyl hydrolase [Candidatus Cyclobacteriaceae bacterium M3_2C_046]